MHLSLTHPVDGIFQSTTELYKQMVKIVAGSLLMALAAQLIIPLQPIPITLQTFTAILLGGLLGKRQAALSVMFYLVQIAISLPVAAGGIVNPLVLIGPKAGYYLGMIAQAYLVGWYCEKSSTLSSIQTFVFLTLVCLLQLTLGTVVLGGFLGAHSAITYGFMPFVGVEIIKSAIAMRLILSYRVRGQSS